MVWAIHGLSFLDIKLKTTAHLEKMLSHAPVAYRAKVNERRLRRIQTQSNSTQTAACDLRRGKYFPEYCN